MVDRLGWNSNPFIAPMGTKTFKSPKFYGKFGIAGITRDSVGTVLGNCDVRLFKSDTDQEVGLTTSDGSGNFTFLIGTNEGWYWIEAYKAGAPDVAGTSVRTLAAVMV